MQTLGFYTFPRFALDKKLNQSEFERDDFANYIREPIFIHENATLKFCVSRDGLFQYHKNSLDYQIQEINKTWKGDSPTYGDYTPVWVEYLRDLNVIYFLLECSLHLNVNIYGLQYYELTYLNTTKITYDDKWKLIRQTNYGGLDLNEMIRLGHYRPKEGDFESFELPRKVLSDLCEYYLEHIFNNEEYIVLQNL